MVKILVVEALAASLNCNAIVGRYEKLINDFRIIIIKKYNLEPETLCITLNKLTRNSKQIPWM